MPTRAFASPAEAGSRQVPIGKEWLGLAESPLQWNIGSHLFINIKYGK